MARRHPGNAMAQHPPPREFPTRIQPRDLDFLRIEGWTGDSSPDQVVLVRSCTPAGNAGRRGHIRNEACESSHPRSYRQVQLFRPISLTEYWDTLSSDCESIISPQPYRTADHRLLSVAPPSFGTRAPNPGWASGQVLGTGVDYYKSSETQKLSPSASDGAHHRHLLVEFRKPTV